MSKLPLDDLDNAPLPICVNSCQLDFGQPAHRLAPICFKVECAFAETRWGNLVSLNADRPVLVEVENAPTAIAKYRLFSMCRLKKEIESEDSENSLDYLCLKANVN